MKAFTSCGMMGLIMVLLLLAGNPSGEADEGGSQGAVKIIFTKHFQNTLFDVTEHAAYSVEILLDDEEYAIGKNVIGIVIHDARDEDVRGAEITFVLKDLVAGKDSTMTPMVTDKGNGLYIVSGLDLQKEGKWELTIRVRKGRTEDLVKFVLPEAIKARVPKGRYSP
jgi:YtkA-like